MSKEDLMSKEEMISKEGDAKMMSISEYLQVCA